MVARASKAPTRQTLHMPSAPPAASNASASPPACETAKLNIQSCACARFSLPALGVYGGAAQARTAPSSPPTNTRGAPARALAAASARMLPPPGTRHDAMSALAVCSMPRPSRRTAQKRTSPLQHAENKRVPSGDNASDKTAASCVPNVKPLCTPLRSSCAVRQPATLPSAPPVKSSAPSAASASAPHATPTLRSVFVSANGGALLHISTTPANDAASVDAPTATARAAPARGSSAASRVPSAALHTHTTPSREALNSREPESARAFTDAARRSNCSGASCQQPQAQARMRPSAPPVYSDLPSAEKTNARTPLLRTYVLGQF